MFEVLLLLPAWAVAGLACARLCLTAVRAAAEEAGPRGGPRRDPDPCGLTLYEAAFLSGGPRRVADLTLVSMARQRRLLLARTGWATVVDPDGRDAMERSVLGAIGPQGQARIAPVRAAAATADTVVALAERLVCAGLAVPDDGRPTLAEGVRQARAAAVAVAGLGATALLLPTRDVMPPALLAAWFALPLALVLGCLTIARFEVYPYARRASPAGQRLLGSLLRGTDGVGRSGRRSGSDRALLLAVAVRGVRAVGEPDLLAAFAHRERCPEADHDE